MSDSVERVVQVLNKLAQARTRNLTSFGADQHKFLLRPTLSEEAVGAFESKHRIALPEDYRAFILHAGNGGCGPYYGIYPLEKWDSFANLVLSHVPDDFLASPCPLKPGIPKTDDWQEHIDRKPYQGTLSIGTQGCSYAMQLIVTGDHAGRVVYVNTDGGPPYMVHQPDFLSWYERWLNELLDGYQMEWFGFGPGGTEDDLFAILDDTDVSDSLKCEAIMAFPRLPRLSETGRRKIQTYFDHPVDRIRSGACAAVRAFRVMRSLSRVSRLLRDSSVAVRQSAVLAVMTLEPDTYAGEVLQLLRDESDPDVASSAFFKLRDCGALSKAELIRIIQGSSLSELRGLAAHAAVWGVDDFQTLVWMLADSNSQVRLYATLGLRQFMVPETLPVFVELLETESDSSVTTSVLNGLAEFGDVSVVPALLKVSVGGDDFHRLAAMEALSAIGDERALPLALSMLRENRPPLAGGTFEPSERPWVPRRDAKNAKTIAQLLREILKTSPNKKLRDLR